VSDFAPSNVDAGVNVPSSRRPATLADPEAVLLAVTVNSPARAATATRIGTPRFSASVRF
jgi:hypothetical protein